jgi:Rrf2 family protein
METVTYRSKMSASTKLSNSVKALCYLARVAPEGKASSEISSKTGINASKIRWLLSMLKRQGIVISVMGVNGGFRLNREPQSINLQEIYCAIEDSKAFHLNVLQNGEEQRGEESINKYFLNLFEDIQQDIEKKMLKISLKDILDNAGKFAIYY